MNATDMQQRIEKARAYAEHAREEIQEALFLLAALEPCLVEREVLLHVHGRDLVERPAEIDIVHRGEDHKVRGQSLEGVAVEHFGARERL